ncbi:MAG TPA: DNA-binding response regulator [Clostridiales bacterium]|nr:DNA-binding response regulator [Clostridiales bacterium]
MKLLLVEDERDLSDAVKKVLEISKYDVKTAYDGEEALAILNAEKFDGVILDVMMPKLDGVSVLKILREKGDQTPVLMLTAKAETDDKVSGLDAGADDYLTKPFVVKELLARIRAITRRSGLSDCYSVGNTTLDPNVSELKTANGSVRLTNKEFKLTEYLMRNKNILVSTEKIMDAVWDIESEAEINVVWVFISALRKKLELIGSDCKIKAVRGVGYKLTADV